ncbi:MAG: hypothetical protein ACKO91_00680 [Acidimicrobiales bacterium]
MPGRARSLAATVVGWVIVVLLAWWLLGALVGTLLWLLRAVLLVAVLLGLIWLYVWLRRPRPGR